MDDLAPGTGGSKTAIRPFHVKIPESELVEMRRRIVATRWPERETVPDDSQGVQLATVQALARYWAKEYDWRKVEARLNAVPNYLTEIDGPQAGLRALDEIGQDPALRRYHLFDATMGELCRRAGDPARARTHFEAALSKTNSRFDAELIARRLAKCV